MLTGRYTDPLIGAQVLARTNGRLRIHGQYPDGLGPIKDEMNVLPSNRRCGSRGGQVLKVQPRHADERGEAR